MTVKPDPTVLACIGHLAGAAATLNERSDALNELIGIYEDALTQANIGASVWVPLPPNPPYQVELWELGYCKCGSRWCLAVRRKSATTDLPFSSAVALLTAPRAVRVRALDHLQTLVRALIEHVSEISAAIDLKVRP